jgi:hypothetical protein
MQVFTSQPAKQELLLFSLAGADMNSTADQAFTKQFGFTNFVITRIRAGELVGQPDDGGRRHLHGRREGRQCACRRGPGLCDADRRDQRRRPDARGCRLTGVQTITPILSLTTGQGSAMTADFYVFGVPLT